MRILYIDDILPAQVFGFGYPRAAAILSHLVDAGLRVSLFPTHAQAVFGAAPTDHDFNQLEIIPSASLPHPQQSHLLRDIAPHFDVIWISRQKNLAIALDFLRSKHRPPLVLYDAECIPSLREHARERVLERRPSSTARHQPHRLDAECMKLADFVTTVSDKEGSVLRSLGIASPLLLTHCAPTYSPSASFEQRSGILFVGQFQTSLVASHLSPNIDAISHYVLNIHPIVCKLLPSTALLSIVGQGSCEIDVSKTDDVTAIGPVRDLFPVYERSRVFVVPTRFSAGIPIKVIEAMAAGVPCVLTRHIAEQLQVASVDGALIADSDMEFAELVSRVHSDKTLWIYSQQAGLDIANKIAGPSVFRSQIDIVVTTLRETLRGMGRKCAF